MTTIDSLSSLGSAGGTTAASTGALDAGSAERFLKLLVTQMQNQDPLNPMDNAQITSQMAQINTVNGIEKLNGTVAGLNRQFVQLQALQGATLVGRAVTLPGDRLDMQAGVGVGGFELGATADRVKVEVLNPAGRVVGSLELGAHSPGRHGFEWTPPAGAAEGTVYRFRVLATAGAAAVPTAALMRDHVNAVNLYGDTLTLDTRYSGSVDYSAVKAFN